MGSRHERVNVCGDVRVARVKSESGAKGVKKCQSYSSDTHKKIYTRG